MFQIRQNFERPRIADIAGAIGKILSDLSLPLIRPGSRIAITAGSRGIADIVETLRAVVGFFRSRGGLPFIVPAMGSHGGATSEGQVDVLSHLGITETSVGAQIRSSMEVVQIGEIFDGIPVYLDRIAPTADHIVIVNRIKPHTKFKGPIESGLVKMMAIGLGKRSGAELYHRAALQYTFPRVLQEAGHSVMEHSPILCGIGIVENAYDETASIMAATPQNLEEEEESWLERAKELMPRLPFNQIDLLIVDEIGKEISGVGMDPNITGRNREQLGVFPHPVSIRYVFVRDLTRGANGNATGIGLADLTTCRLVEKIDLNETCTNCATSLSFEKAAIPLFFRTDREAVSVALSSLGLVKPRDARIVRIRNTLAVSRLLVSQAFQAEFKGREDISIVQGPTSLSFGADGNLDPLSQD